MGLNLPDLKDTTVGIAVESVPLRSGTTSEWSATTLILGVGELGLDTTTGTLKAGDGATPFADLPGVGGGGTDLTPTYVVSAQTPLGTSMVPISLVASEEYPLRTDLFTLADDTLTCLVAGDYRVDAYLVASLSGAGFGDAGVLEIETAVSVNEENAGPAFNYYPRASTWVDGIDQALNGVTFGFPQTLAEGDEIQLISRYVVPSLSSLDLGTATVSVGGIFAALTLTPL